MKIIQIVLLAVIATILCVACKSEKQKKKEQEQRQKQLDIENTPLYRDKFVGVWIIGRFEKEPYSDTLTITKQQDGLLYVAFSQMMVPIADRAWLNQNGAVDGREREIVHSTTDSSYYYLWIIPANPNDKNRQRPGFGYQYKDDGLCLSVSSKSPNNLSYNHGEHQYYRNK